MGKNYAKHAAEMGSSTPASPIWFWKPDSAIVGDGEAVHLPEGIGAVHHEVELAVRIDHRGRPAEMTVAVDITARDLQAEAKKNGHPWAMAKGFHSFLPLGPWVPAKDLDDQRLRLSLDGEVKQDGHTRGMSWDVPTLLDHASKWVTLREGDVLLTGTPEGVGPMLAGQTMVAELVGHVRLTNPIV